MQIREYMNRITVNPEVMVGKPVIRGLRITVEQVVKTLDKLVSNPSIYLGDGSRAVIL
jgi:uncharacterized protein (DUF433 family)